MRQMKRADLYRCEQYFHSVKVYKDVTVFDVLQESTKNEEPHRVFLSSTRKTLDVWSRDQQPSTFQTALECIMNLYNLQSITLLLNAVNKV